ncbi:molybdopterin-dependent oxidoreductase [Noviherbaspirillum autotrophicum]|uniref:Molybdopterin-binding oxidoreductase n=1 Tax=Noviherbaspirillum autotrophicum TaxID=709839 RepID=A0A0C2BYM6_9BURK|nr:molybdopterin-dependent oxidoreductase [Noviherbaspirillum autotrophicum]KIF83131.1 molybdopterin-binding oxidoreductase [Noviherbaspirillum autotrophicum]
MPHTETTAYRICPLCEACCGLELKISDNKVVSIRGHDADVFSRGYICPKGAALKDLHEDPDRLRTPLIKRDGRFVEASWDEAFAEIARRLPPIVQEHGSDAAAVVIGNPAVHKIGLINYVPRLARALGTRNIFSASTLDQMPKQLSAGLMFGHWLSIPVPDIERCDYLLMLGANPMVSNGSLWTVPDFRGKAKAMRARGGRIVVIDPRRSETAAAADEHHFIRPGADVFLLLGLVHALFDEQLVRPGRLAEHVNGLDPLRDAVRAFTPEHVAARCGFEAATIRRLARELAAAPRAAVYGRIGTCTQQYGTLCSWLVDVLNVLTGNLDREGGAMFPKAAAFAANTAGKPGSGRGIATGRRKSRVSGAPEVLGELPMGCLAEEIETPGAGQVRALISIAGNPVLSAPNGERLSAALEALDFMVSVDIYLNETTRHADVILPGSSPLEDAHYDTAFPQFSYRNHARYSRAVLAREPGQPPEWQILLRLAAIAQGQGAQADVLALDDALFADDVRRATGEHAEAILAALAHLKGPERQLDYALRLGPYGDLFGQKPDGLNLAKLKAASGGIDLGPLKPRIPEALRTPSGKIELAPAALLDDLQRAASDLEQPAPALVVIGRRQVRSCNSWMHNLTILAKGPFRCTALVHPADAQRAGLQEGGAARIASGSRALEVRVQISDEMMPGVVSLPHGWGHDKAGTRMTVAAERPGANLNVLLDETLRDPLSGNAVLSGIPVEIQAIN